MESITGNTDNYTILMKKKAKKLLCEYWNQGKICGLDRTKHCPYTKATSYKCENWLKRIKRRKKEIHIPTIIRDSREHRGAGYLFRGKEAEAKIVMKKLATGDYSLEGYEQEIVIERKRINELFGNFAGDRERFMREVERMGKISYKFLLIEGSFKDLVQMKKVPGKVSVKLVVATLISLMIKHNIKVVFAGNPKLAEQLAYRILIKFFNYKVKREI